MAASSVRKVLNQDLALIISVGFIVRFCWPLSLGIDHFDEGIYATSALWVLNPGSLTESAVSVIPYGPPLLPALISISYFVLGGPSDFAAILPSILCGTASIWLIYKLTKKIFSHETGLTAAIFLCCSGVSIAFSRSVLTESPLIMVWLLAISTGLWFLNQPGLKSAFFLGLTVGLAQLTKYNGGMTGLIVCLTTLADYFLVPRGTKNCHRLLFKRISWGIIAFVISALIYLPWFLFVEEHGGYRALMKHHGSYVMGSGFWLRNLKLQLAQAWLYQFQPILIMIPALLLMTLTYLQRSVGNSWIQLLCKLILVCLILIFPNSYWVLSIASCPLLFRQNSIGTRLLGVWLLTMTMVTPMYHPYARLWLPTHVVSIIIISPFMQTILNCQSVSFSTMIGYFKPLKVSSSLLTVGLAVTVLSTGISTVFNAATPTVWSSRTNLHEEVENLIPLMQEASGRGESIHLFINPAVKWQLQNLLAMQGLTGVRFSILGDVKDYFNQTGPLVLDRSLVSEEMYYQMSSRIRISRFLDSDRDADVTLLLKAQRGMITTLDVSPGFALGSRQQEMRLQWIEK